MTTAITAQPLNSNHMMINPQWQIDRDNSNAGYLLHKDKISRIGQYVGYLNDNGLSWFNPDLNAYARYLQNRKQSPLSVATINAHINTIKGRYRRLLKDNQVRSMLYASTDQGLSQSDKKAYIDELLTRLENTLDEKLQLITGDNDKAETIQDKEAGKHTRLTPSQMNQLIASPDTETLTGLRDTAILALLASTGIREAELSNLRVSDLRAHDSKSGELCLLIRHGKGSKQRLVPYGELSGCLVIVEKWLQHAGIVSGQLSDDLPDKELQSKVFRGFFKGGKKIRHTGISTRSIQRIIARYPVAIDGKQVNIAPHDMRRSYARNLYDAGMKVEKIQANLGHADTEVTLRYIGIQETSGREPKGIYSFPAIDV